MNTSVATFSLKHTQQFYTAIKIFVSCAEITGRGFGGFGGTEHWIWTPPAPYVLLDLRQRLQSVVVHSLPYIVQRQRRSHQL